MSNTKPVKISGAAHKTYADLARKWSGWRDLSLTFGAPPEEVSPWAMTDLMTHAMTVNADELVLSPKRVLNHITPFRLRQEAVLTGAIMHEAAHARYSKWMPRNDEERDALRHSDGSKVAEPTRMLANLAEEARIEGLMVAHVDQTTTVPLGWVLRASAAHLIPTTVLDMDPNVQIMQLIQSWLLRAGRHRAIRKHARPGTFPVKGWVTHFDQTLAEALIEFTRSTQGNEHAGRQAFGSLIQMVEWDGVDPNLSSVLDKQEIGFVDENEVEIEREVAHPDHAGPFMSDMARQVLTLLFPETGAEGAPMVGGGCGTASQGQAQSGDESAEQGEGEGSGQSEADKPGDGESEGAGKPEWAEELTNAETSAKNDAKAESKQQSKAEVMTPGGTAGGVGAGGAFGSGRRGPTKDEREIAKGAERFLRDLINPSESSKITLTSSPSATVDPAALASWKAGGMVREPHFFKRTKRVVESSPPVKIAILVDVSSSMDQMQKPSAVLSWALASAALDLRNFAGRGQQVESTLIHWGDSARVVVKNGARVEGISTSQCREGTYAMAQAYSLIEEEIGDFFEIGEKPSNRLIIHFTDWELSYGAKPPAAQCMARALEAGVNTISVVPAHGYDSRTFRSMTLDARVQRGINEVLTYNPNKISQVWDHAAKALSRI